MLSLLRSESVSNQELDQLQAMIDDARRDRQSREGQS